MNKLNFTKTILLSIVFTCLTSCTFEPDNASVSSQTQTLESPVELSVGEGFENPLGYYEREPRFSWKIKPSSQLVTQSAYRLQVAFDKQFSEESLAWDSGKVVSNQNAWRKYEGKPLASRNKLHWRVKIWDEKNLESDWSDIAVFELGLLDNSDWQAKWINHTDTALRHTPSQTILATPQYLRKTFELKDNVLKARLYVSAKGVFKAFINGQDIAADEVLTPGWTPYQKRIESLSYDVTSLLNKGQNVLASKIAGGWYSMRVFNHTDKEHLLPAQFLAQLELTYQDGSTELIKTDNSWQSSLQGPIRFASIYDGERYEQANEMPGWNSAEFDLQSHLNKWTSVEEEEIGTSINITPKRHAPIRRIESLDAKAIVTEQTDHDNAVVIFDFGQNMVGVPEVTIPAIAGQEIRIRYAEALHKGEFYTDNYRSAKSTNYILPSQSGLIQYSPTFTYHGYRYIEVSGFDANITPSLDWAKAIVQHSDIKLQNSFTSDHTKLNQLTQNIEWGLRSNFFDIPLDCPQRDERLGWTGDAQVFATPSMYLADVYAFWSAWLQSMREDQGEDGLIPLYVPFVEWINWASSGWGDAATIIPYELYILTGDKQILEDNYHMMQQWLLYHAKHAENNVSTMKSFGDWLQPFSEASDTPNNRGDTHLSLISTAFYAHSVNITRKAALALEKPEDAQELEALFKRLKTTFTTHFFDGELNVTKGKSTQTAYLLGLSFDLFTSEQVPQARQKLLAQIEQADMHLRTGFLGTPLLLSELQKAGHSDLAYNILFNETYPSWFYSINNGATTTWERWNSYSLEEGFNPQGMNSLNHYAYGSVARWFYEGILGINASEPGFKRIRIAPQFNAKLGQASGHYDTPQGRVSVSWAYDTENSVSVKIVVPPNSLADFVVPSSMRLVHSGDTKGLTQGQYQYKLKML